ncbi:MAG: hypothetical protein AAF798_20505 [Bacteroidota bacterium]
MATIPIPMNKTANRLLQWPLADLLKNKGIQVQRFSWNPEQTRTFIGKEQTKITLPAHAIENTIKESATDAVTLELVELYTKSSMLFAGRTSTSDDRILHNYGQLFIQLYHKQVPLRLIKPITIQLQEQTLKKDALEERLYRSGTTTTRSFSGQAGVDWKQSDSPILRAAMGKLKYSFRFQLQKLGWVQCAAPLPAQSKQVMVSARYRSDAGPLDEKVAFLLFDKYQAMASMYPQNRHFSAFNIPAGQKATIIILGRRKSMYFFGKQSTDKTTNTSFEIPLERHSIQQLFTNLKLLNT